MPEQPLAPSIIVVFGITGDLAQRYLLPALYHLFQEKLLDEHTEIVGLTRQNLSAANLYDRVELCINETDKVCDPVALKAIQRATTLLQFDPQVGADYDELLRYLNSVEDKHDVCMNRLYYLSIPPSVFQTAVRNLGEHGLNGSCQHGNVQTRLLVEKPFGSDLASAQELIDSTNASFSEEQVYRIDHYLAKETAQNILTFRAHNPIFAPIWNSQNIDRIDIIASEKIGIEGRANFYEGVGALRDLIQSHLLQLLAITTMDMPVQLNSATIHEQKEKLFQTITPAEPDEARRGQYDTYHEEVDNPGSVTETFAAIKLNIATERWQGTHITIATGKALQEKRTEVRVTFRRSDGNSENLNQLTFRIQPNEGIHLQLKVKQPGYEHRLQDALMDFSYQQTFGDHEHPNAYERVLVDAIRGDRTLFATSEEVLQSWRIIEPIIQRWQDSTERPNPYAAGSPIDDLL